MRVKFQCPVCKKEVTIQIPKVEDFTEFILLHQDHAAKIYIDEHGFIRRAWPVKLITADEQPKEPPQVESGKPPEKDVELNFAVGVGRGRAVVTTLNGEKIAEFEAEELGMAILKAEQILKHQTKL